jgi:hypothetical protein
MEADSMPSPFPGMDPYLENPDIWPGFHNWLIASLADHVEPNLPPQYYVAIERRLYLAATTVPETVGIPDLTVIGRGRERPGNGSTAGSSGAGASNTRSGVQVLTVAVPVPEQVQETYLEIRGLSEGDVVTALEILSPWNKRPGEGSRVYEAKRQRTLGSATHLIEVDLLRGGDPPPIYVQSGTETGGVPGDFRILIARAGRRMAADLYAWTARDPVPSFPLPLRTGEAELEVDLQSVLQRLYDRGRYRMQIDYRREPVPPLAPDDAAWADHLLREKGLR